MEGIVIPELILKSVVDGIIKTVSDDLKNNSNERNTILYHLFGDLEYNKFKYFEQAMNIFNLSNAKARQLKTKLSFDGDLSSFPMIYITTGSDSHSFQGIGLVNEEYYKDDDNLQRPLSTCRFKGDSSVVIVSDSIEEVLVIYHTMRSMFISVSDTLSDSGLESIRIGGADVRLDDSLTPKGVFIRAMSVGYEYDIRVPSLLSSFQSVTSDRPNQELGGVDGTPEE